MNRISDYFKFYETGGATAVAADIELGEIGYIAGGRAIGQGSAPSDSLTAFYATYDATITQFSLAAWKTAYGKYGKVLGVNYPGEAPPTGGIFALQEAEVTHAPTGDTFSI